MEFMWIFVAILSVIWLFMLRKGKRSKLPLPPGPKGIPILGNALQVDFATLHFPCEEWAREYGPIFSFRVMGIKAVVLNSASLVKKAFMNEEYSKKMNDKPVSFLGRYIFFNCHDVITGQYSEELWILRRMLFKGQHFYGAGVKEFEGIAQREIGRLMDEVKDLKGKDFAPDPLIEKSLGNMVSILLSGEPASDTDANLLWQYQLALNNLMNPSVETALWNFPFLRFLPGKYRTVYQTAIEKQNAVLEKFLYSLQRTYDREKLRGLTDIILNQFELDESKLLKKQHLKGVISDFIVASLITTTSTITSCLLTLLNNPTVLDKIYAEIQEVVGDRDIEIADKANLHYTHAACIECQRYSTQVPLILPHNTTADVEFEGYHIPKGTWIYPNAWFIHHDEKTWGDPWNVRPERFLDENGHFVPPEHPLRQSFIAFGIGKRICPGEVLAKSRIFLYVTNFVQKFKLLPPEEGKLQSPDPRLYLPSASMLPPPFKMRAVLRT